MLKHLHIQNYALIEKLSIDFEEGLTVITGETGAGKSILLGALSLIIGQRADMQVLKDASRKCIIEGYFDISRTGLEPLFSKYQLDMEPVSIFRREITPHGKSRAFVNDTPVNLQVLKELSEKIIDIHSQHQNLLLGESSFQFDVVDNFSGIHSRVAEYRKQFAALQQRKQELFLLEEREMRSKTDLDYYRFQYDELHKAELNESAYGGWEAEIQLIRNAEEIQTNLETARYLLSENDLSVSSRIYDVIQQLKPLSKYSPDYGSLVERLESVLIELKDIIQDADRLSATVSHDPERAASLEARLDAVNKLFLKHHVSSVAELIDIREQYRQRIDSVQTMEEQIAAEKRELSEMEGRLQQAASWITEERGKAIPQIEKEILTRLKQLGMQGARLKLLREATPGLTHNGSDRIRFLFSANPGAEPKEISKVASGGELSRLMLCIKSLLSQRNLLPCIIFDEIDTGISGKIGGKIGDIMQGMASNMQVITITHLPQIAARGQHHFLVYKTIEDQKTKTSIKPLNKEEQVTQIAKMLGGDSPTNNMIKTAKELIINK